MRSVTKAWLLYLGTVAFALVLLSVPLVAKAQAGKVYRVGVLLSTSQSFESRRINAFRQGLRERGYVEGQNVIIEYRYGAGQLDRLPRLAAELVGLNVDVIVTGGTQPTRAAQQATKTIPIVMTIVGDPIASGFIGSLSKPGENITGLTQISVELGAKRLELLKEAFPNVSRVAVFVDPTTSARGAMGILHPTRMAAEALGVKLIALELQGPNPDLEGAFRAAVSERVGGLLVAPGPALDPNSKRIVDMAAKRRLPAMYPSSEYVDVGGLMSYAPSFSDLFRRAATYVDKILKGVKPRDLPVEQPTKFELIINLKTAQALGLTIPPSIWARADQVIE